MRFSQPGRKSKPVYETHVVFLKILLLTHLTMQSVWRVFIFEDSNPDLFLLYKLSSVNYSWATVIVNSCTGTNYYWTNDRQCPSGQDQTLCPTGQDHI